MRLVQRVVVVLPVLLVVGERLVEARAERALRRRDRLGLGGAEAEREHRLAVAVEDDPRRLLDVALRRVGGRRQRVGGVELDEAVARVADEAARGLRERAVERGVDGLRVVAVGRVRRGDRIGGDEHRVAGRAVDRRRVGAAVARAAAAVAVHRRVEADVEPKPARASALNATRIRTVFRLGSVMYSVSILYLPLFAVAVTLHAIPPVSSTASAE